MKQAITWVIIDADLWHHMASPSHSELRHLIALWSNGCNIRLFHSPSLVVIGLSVGYETWPPISWLHDFVICWSKYRLGLPSAPLHYGLTWPAGIPTVFQTPVTVTLQSLNGRQMPVQGDCERVYCNMGVKQRGLLPPIEVRIYGSPGTCLHGLQSEVCVKGSTSPHYSWLHGADIVLCGTSIGQEINEEVPLADRAYQNTILTLYMPIICEETHKI